MEDRKQAEQETWQQRFAAPTARLNLLGSGLSDRQRGAFDRTSLATSVSVVRNRQS